MAKRKIGYRRLSKMYKDLEATVALWQTSNARLSLERDELRRKVNERVDTAMLQERIKLANSIGQMTDAISHAIRFVVGKEVL